jgi:CIC family chloride channel protein
MMLFVLGPVLGALAAGAAIAFRDLIGLIQLGAFGFDSEQVFSLARELPWWRVLLVPALGGLAVGLFIHFVMPGRQPQGVAQVMEAAALRGGRMGIRAGLGAALASAVSIGTGAWTGGASGGEPVIVDFGTPSPAAPIVHDSVGVRRCVGHRRLL